MKVELWLVGKTKDRWVAQGIDEYLKRCSRFTTVTTIIVADSKYTQSEAIRQDETTRLTQQLSRSHRAFTILLDETGRQLTSPGFATLLQKQQDAGNQSFRFIIGGAYGVDEELRNSADEVLSLSQMTFPHQVVRIIFLEQLYRAFTILRGEGYHHA